MRGHEVGEISVNLLLANKLIKVVSGGGGNGRNWVKQAKVGETGESGECEHERVRKRLLAKCLCMFAADSMRPRVWSVL